VILVGLFLLEDLHPFAAIRYISSDPYRFDDDKPIKLDHGY
jgi:hypothetical protein